jgi:hypothetical protein
MILEGRMTTLYSEKISKEISNQEQLQLNHISIQMLKHQV